LSRENQGCSALAAQSRTRLKEPVLDCFPAQHPPVFCPSTARFLPQHRLFTAVRPAQFPLLTKN
jgi:hypothetical protein